MVYGQTCNEARGSGKKAGHVKNFLLMGLVYGVKKAQGCTSEERQRLSELVSDRVKSSDKVDLWKFQKLGYMVAYCQVWQGRKASGVNLLMRGMEGQEVGVIIKRHLLGEGSQEFDPSPGRPVAREMRDALRKSRVKGESKGTGR